MTKKKSKRNFRKPGSKPQSIDGGDSTKKDYHVDPKSSPSNSSAEIKTKRITELKIRRKEQREGILRGRRTAAEWMQQAQARTAAFETCINETTSFGGLTDTSAKAYYKEFRKVVEAADVILHVLDARDPEGTRCPSMEELVKNKSKKLVLILNKADLVPKRIIEGWLAALRREYPTVIFKASTQMQAKRLSHTHVAKPMRSEDAFSTSVCVGADTLMQLLKNYCRNKDIKTLISVGVVGLPNVGKSSLINSLKRSRACNVGATPGVTKNMQTISLDSKINLIDSPGIIVPSANSTDTQFSLRNAVKVETLEDPITPVDAILSRAGHKKMMDHYKLPEFDGVDSFLTLLARKRGKFLKQGVPDIQAAAIMVLKDWNGGKIKYYTQPPSLETIPDNAKLLSGYSKEFCLDDMEAQDASCMETLSCIKEEEISMDVDGDEESEDVGEAQILASNCVIETPQEEAPVKPVEKLERWETERKIIDFKEVNLKKLQKSVMKKKRKEAKRNERGMDALADLMTSKKLL